MKPKDFTSNLMHWHYNDNTRQMPWKGEKDPYKIWLSEVILQQTRVEQGWSYYERFISAYPTMKDLAKSTDETAFKLWEGLGYYNRCKNLLHTARYISNELEGIFPHTYEAILALKGVGPYTAAAIASFAFNLPYAVVDGNVFRVLARYFGHDTAIDSAEGKAFFSGLAQNLIDQTNPALYNQAIMDFGATVCKPALPLCNSCPLQKNCSAYKNGTVNQLPVKEKRLLKKNRWLTWFIFLYQEKVLVHKRSSRDIWQNLFEFYFTESEENPEWNNQKIFLMLKEQLGISKATLTSISPVFSQQLTHQHIKARFIKVELYKAPSSLQAYEWVSLRNIKELAFPGIINQYLQAPSVQSTLF